VQWLVLSGGEPLMHPELSRLIDVLRKTGIRISILTSGMLLESNASVVAQNVDDLIVSLDGPQQIHDRIRGVPGAFEQLTRGVRAVRRLKPGFPVGARCTVQRGNYSQLREVVKTARRMDLQSVSFLAADLISQAFNRPRGWTASRKAQVALTAEETRELEDEIEKLIDELDTFEGFVLENPQKLRRIVLHFRAHLGLAEPVAPNCNAPWVSAAIDSDGTVRPCFFHGAIGNIRKQSLTDILNSDQAFEFRRTLDIAGDPVCRRCVCSLHLPDNSKAIGI
jgi:MoaA/NifB/PqqE/SkfB family radical SAM enzyme